jgi:hypothetical protein
MGRPERRRSASFVGRPLTSCRTGAGRITQHSSMNVCIGQQPRRRGFAGSQFPQTVFTAVESVVIFAEMVVTSAAAALSPESAFPIAETSDV